jgi:hypothetical protein
MLEDFRDHDPNPTDQEREWMAANPLGVLVRLLALASLALAIGLTASSAFDIPTLTTVASAPQR